jgi:hypothetical protein
VNKAEEQKLAQLLAELEPGFLPYEIFKQVARLVVLPIIEFVPVRQKDGQVEVLLLNRSKFDDIWPGELHTPGTVIRPTDSTGEIYKAFDRILNDELAGTKVSSPHYVGSILHSSKRGMEQAQVYWVEVLEEPKVGQFYQISNLPKNTMQSQTAFINQAAKNYLDHTTE